MSSRGTKLGTVVANTFTGSTWLTLYDASVNGPATAVKVKLATGSANNISVEKTDDDDVVTNDCLEAGEKEYYRCGYGAKGIKKIRVQQPAGAAGDMTVFHACVAAVPNG